MFKLLRDAVFGVSLLCADVAGARPFTVDDLLRTESFGEAQIDPTGRWLVFEQRDRYDTALRYDYNTLTSWSLTRLRLVDLKGPRIVRPALRTDPGPGVLIGAFSPQGRRLAVYRLQDHSWRLGVVTLASGATQWFDLTPQEDGPGRALQWLSDTQLLVIARSDGLAPLTLRRGYVLADRLPAFWAAAARGQGAHTVLGSGAYAGVRTRAPASALVQLDVVNGAQRSLATGAFTDLEVSPDRKHVALLETGHDIQPDGDAPVRGLRGLETEESRLSIVNLVTGERRQPCAACDILPQLLSWSPSGRQLLVLARRPGELWSAGRLQRIDPASGAATRVGGTLQPRLDQNPVGVWTAWLGEDPLVYGHRDEAQRDDWFRAGIGESVNLTEALPPPDKRIRLGSPAGFAVLAGDAVWRFDGRWDKAGAASTGFAPLVGAVMRGGARLSRAPPAAILLTDGAGSVAALTTTGLALLSASPVSADDTVLSATGEGLTVRDVTDPQGVENLVLEGAGQPRQIVATLNRHLAGVDRMEARAVHHRDADGRTLTSWLYLPSGSHQRLPLLVRPYLGAAFTTAPRDPPGELGFALNLRLLTSSGYAVLVPSLPKPLGGLTEPAAGVADRILAVVDAASADPAVADRFDPDRAALVGYSFGGYTVMAALTQTHRFRAGVSLSGISDLTALWSGLSPFSLAEPEAGYTSNWRAGGVETTQTQLDAPPWIDPDRYTRNSPLYAAGKIEAPLLLAHGVLDQVPLAQSEAMFSALFRQRKDAVLVTYWGALHTLTAPGDLRDLYERVFAFLKSHLGERTAVSH